ncbi:oligosaccharide flippase family protein [Bacillus salipaludis]|uniref:lipopolysaccharide biosynthesis protein n=1 Tax=Bacillus salipaludis TaxID=2547811 RepID=UPI003D1D301E
MKSKLFKKFLTFSYGSAVGSVIAFMSTIVITRILNPEEFGKVSLFTLFINIAMIVAIFGTDQAFVRFFYEEKENIRGKLLYNCLKVSAYILIPLLIVVIFFRKKLLYFLFSEYSVMVLIAVVIAVISQVLYRFGTLVVRMQQKGNIYSILEILNKSFIFIGILFFYRLLGNSYEVMVYSTVVSFIFLVIFLILSQKKFWGLNNIKSYNSKHSKVEIFFFSYPLVFTTAIMWVFDGLDKFSIRHWNNFNELGLYAAAFKIIGLLSIIQTAFTTFWTPVAYETFQRDPSNTFFYAKISKLVSFFMMIIGVVVIMMKNVIIMLLGGGYKDSSLMLSFLVFIPIMYTISETTVLGINFYKKVKWHMAIVSIACFVNLIGNWLLVPHYGGLGASISTGVSYILFFSLRTFISLKYYKVKYGLKKVYISTTVLLLFSSYTLIPNKPVNEQFIGLFAILLIILIYSNDIKHFINLQGVSKK